MVWGKSGEESQAGVLKSACLPIIILQSPGKLISPHCLTFFNETDMGPNEEDIGVFGPFSLGLWTLST